MSQVPPEKMYLVDAIRLRHKVALPKCSFLTRQQVGLYLDRDDVHCAICGEIDSFTYSDQEDFYFLFECGHYFHGSCSMTWFKSQNGVAASCPMCRAPVKKTVECAVVATKWPNFQCQTNHECAFCFKAMEFDQWIQLECGHTFHHQCFASWVERRNNCVLCRSRPVICTEPHCDCEVERSLPAPQ
jgi:hypothetical protein